MDLENIKDEIKAKKKEFSSYLFLSLSSFYLFYFILSITVDNFNFFLQNSKEYYFVGFAFCSYIGFLISKLEYSFIKLYRTLSLFLIVIACYNILVHCHFSIVVYSILIPLQLLISIVYSRKTTYIFAAGLLLFCLFSISLSEYFELSQSVQIPKNLYSIDLTNKLIIVSISTYLSIFLIYYYKQFKILENKFKNSISRKYDSKTNILNSNFGDKDDKLEKIYNEVVLFFEIKKGYRDPNFSLKKLASAVNSNETYVSKAIKKYGNTNFINLINSYRINQVILDLTNNQIKNYTIEYIYKNAGFKQQSTFNRVFKEFTNDNPSSFINKLQNQKKEKEEV